MHQTRASSDGKGCVCHSFYVSWQTESVVVIVRSWEPLMLVWGPLHKRTVNKLEGIFILRPKQLNRLLFLDSVMITEIKWKASISEGKKHSLSWTPFWCRWHSAEAAVFILHLGMLFTTRVMNRLKHLNLVSNVSRTTDYSLWKLWSEFISKMFLVFPYQTHIIHLFAYTRSTWEFSLRWLNYLLIGILCVVNSFLMDR